MCKDSYQGIDDQNPLTTLKKSNPLSPESFLAVVYFDLERPRNFESQLWRDCEDIFNFCNVPLWSFMCFPQCEHVCRCGAVFSWNTPRRDPDICHFNAMSSCALLHIAAPSCILLRLEELFGVPAPKSLTPPSASFWNDLKCESSAQVSQVFLKVQDDTCWHAMTAMTSKW